MPAEKHSRSVAPPLSEIDWAKPQALPPVRLVIAQTSARTAQRAISPPFSDAEPTKPHASVPPARRPSTEQSTMRMSEPLTVRTSP